MNHSEKFLLEVEAENKFYTDNCSEKEFGAYSFLLCYFISTYKSINELDNDVFPYLESLNNKKGIINDWNNFDWEGKVCFRNEYVLMIDKKIIQINRMMLFDENKNPVLNDEFQWLEDTLYIENKFTEYVKISILDLIGIFRKWKDFLENKGKTYDSES